jgi:pyruvate/2-oxoglutarate/acetoin dehydrogenase E1 component
MGVSRVSELTYLASISKAMSELLGACEDTLFIGEDILDPYGGAFKVARGLSSAYADRVLATPISEAAIVGMATGAALRGVRVIAEIMFADFLALGFDQIFNHLTKYQAMYAGPLPLHVVIRAPAGGGRGYGPTHSQNPEKYFAGMPGLTVLAPSEFHDPGRLLAAALDSGVPVLFVEGKLLYPRPLADFGALASRDWKLEVRERPGVLGTTIGLTNARGQAADVVVVTYGTGASLAEAVAYDLLLEDELTTDLFILDNLSHIDVEAVFASASSGGCVVTFEEGTKRLGLGAEILAGLCERGWSGKAARVASADTILPSAKHLEERVLASAGGFRRAVRELVAR